MTRRTPNASRVKCTTAPTEEERHGQAPVTPGQWYALLAIIRQGDYLRVVGEGGRLAVYHKRLFV